MTSRPRQKRRLTDPSGRRETRPWRPSARVPRRPAPEPSPGTPLAVAGLFAGIGGIELGLARSGHESKLLCEIDDSACAVLNRQFPGVPLHRDVRTLRSLPRDVELLTAGFPCQDLSQAGMTRGIAGERSGLIREVLSLLEKRRVPWVLIENVPFMLRLRMGRALDVIVGELERLGYRWAYRVVDSRAFGLPQRRQRVFLMASILGDPRSVLFADDAGEQDEPAPSKRRSYGFYWTEGVRGLGTAIDAVPTLKGGSAVGIPSPPAIVLPRGRRVVTPDIRDAERLQGFDADWTLPASEENPRAGVRWKLVGNAVTVNVAEWIGWRLRSPGSYDASEDDPLVQMDAWPTAAWNVGQGRYRSSVSRWPVALPGEPIHRFLRFEPAPLSIRATTGFLSRLTKSTLSRPEWFETVLERHRDQEVRQA
jgi:DNA (cytosine-5)-methyltransferase 1